MTRAVIVFTDEWLPYSPTVLNLRACLEEHGCRARVVTLRSALFKNFEHLEGDVAAFSFPRLLQRLLTRLHLYRAVKLVLFVLRYGGEIRRADLCFGVDALGFLIGRVLGKQPYYVSLEVERDVWFRMAEKLGIRHVLIQTDERFEYLFGGSPRRPQKSILPNSPILERASMPARGNDDLICFGWISAEHGVELCIDALDALPEKRLTLKGPIDPKYLKHLQDRYEPLLRSGRLIVDQSYLEPDDVIPYLGGFAIGFCFYDFTRLSSDDFNYVSCPSGKLFHYMAAGIPVIGADIVGLQVVRQRNCGVLLREVSAASIAEAVTAIEADREGYRRRAMEAAADFDFRRHFDRFFTSVVASS